MTQFRLIIVFLLAGIISCQKENRVESATDNLPSPDAFASGKDTSIDPGDSFFDYCNGGWIKKQNPHPERCYGGVYDGDIAMEQRVEQLKNTVPDIGRFYELMDNIYSQPEKELAFIAAKKAGVSKPESKEEAFRTIGRMMAEGATFPSLEFYLVWDNDHMEGLIVPPMSVLQADEEGRYNLVPLSSTKADASSAAALIAEGMGIQPEKFMTIPELNPYWEVLWNKSPDELYQMMLDSWDSLQMYAIEIPGITKKQAQSKARASLAYTISYHFAQLFVPQGLKEKFLGITKEIQASLRKRIDNVDWMSKTTKQNALAKLDNCGLFVGSPDHWHTDCVASYDGCETLSEAVCRGNQGILKLKSHLMGGTDVLSYNIIQSFRNSDGEMETTDLTMVNAMYDNSFNCVLIYPAMLLPPIMPDEGMSEAFQYAAFVCIGHEFTHGFDSDGSQFDKNGNIRNWWTVADKMNFDDRKQNIIRCYDSMLLDEERDALAYGDGKRTQTENIADLGGFLAVLDAYKARLKKQGFSGGNLKNQLRKFYEAYAYCWRVQYSDAKFNILINSDIHSHARLRVNGVVMNTDLWYELFDVDRDNILYLPPERRAYIW